MNFVVTIIQTALTFICRYYVRVASVAQDSGIDCGEFCQKGSRTEYLKETPESQGLMGDSFEFLTRSSYLQSCSFYDLDTNVNCSPDEFQRAWYHIPKGISVLYHIENQISLFDFHNYFQSKRFYVVASGVVGEQTKLYLVAQRRTRRPILGNQSPRSQTLTRCFVEVSSNSNSLELSVEIRCRHDDQAHFFLNSLKLDDLCVLQN